MMTKNKMQDYMSIILLIGIFASIILVLLGGSLYLIQYGNESYLTSLPLTDAYHPTINQVWHIALSFTPLGLITLGLLMLVLTQMVRVALLIWFYAMLEDYWFTIISTFILFVLMYSLLWRH